MRATRVLLLAATLLAASVAAVPAFAANATDFEGTYVGSVRTSTGANLGAYVWVKALTGDQVDLTVSVGDVSGFPLGSQKMTWTGPDSFTISPNVDEIAVKGSGQATFTKVAGKWQMQGEGEGTVGVSILTVSGSATGSGVKVSDDFEEYKVVLSDQATQTVVVPPGATAEGILAGMSQKQPPISDVEKAEAALPTDVAVLVGIILCAAMGASMSGAEFADMWLEE